MYELLITPVTPDNRGFHSFKEARRLQGRNFADVEIRIDDTTDTTPLGGIYYQKTRKAWIACPQFFTFCEATRTNVFHDRDAAAHHLFRNQLKKLLFLVEDGREALSLLTRIVGSETTARNIVEITEEFAS